MQDETPPHWGAGRAGEWVSFGIWAPGAAEAVLVTEAGAVPLAPGAEGWHTGRAALPPGARYQVRVDGTSVPDPASRCQPEGADGPSELPGAGFAWTDSAWQGRPWHETVLYELHVGTFSAEGTFLGAIQHLDHLAALGMTMVELMPVATFPGARGWGYDGVLPYAPHAAYGTPDDLRRLVDACHARRISVVLDVVYNHFGPASNYVAEYAPGFFTDRHATPWGKAIDFDGAHAGPVRAFFIENAAYWITEFHLDGLRIDAVQAVFDDGEEHVLAAIARRARAAAPGRAVHLTLENDENESRWLEREAGGGPALYAAQWNDDFHHVARVLVTGRRDGYYRDYAERALDRLGRALAEGFSYQGAEESVHRPGLWRGTPSGHLPPSAFVNFLQNHDQVGNTPFGQRLTALAPAERVRLGTAVLLLAPGIPMLFMGQEWGSARPFDYFCDYGPPIADMVRRGRREEFSHLPEFSDPAQVARLRDPVDPATFEGSKLDWDRLGEPEFAGWLAFHRALLAARRTVLTPLIPLIGGWAGTWEAGDGWLRVRWRLADGRALVLAANFSDAVVPLGAGRVLYRLGRGAALGPWEMALLEQAPA